MSRRASTGNQVCSYAGCEYRCSSKSSLEAHKRKNHGEQQLKCNLCPSTFNDQTILNRHKRMKHSNTPKEAWYCFRCQKVVGAPTRLDNAKRHENRSKNSECKGCVFTATQQERDDLYAVFTGVQDLAAAKAAAKAWIARSNIRTLSSPSTRAQPTVVLTPPITVGASVTTVTASQPATNQSAEYQYEQEVQRVYGEPLLLVHQWVVQQEQVEQYHQLSYNHHHQLIEHAFNDLDTENFGLEEHVVDPLAVGAEAQQQNKEQEEFEQTFEEVMDEFIVPDAVGPPTSPAASVDFDYSAHVREAGLYF